MIDEHDSDIKNLLANWGRWSKDNARYRSPWCLIVPEQRGKGIDSDLTSDDMLAVDNAVARLKHASYNDYRLIKLYYRYGFTCYRIAKQLSRKREQQICNKTIQRQLETAEQTIYKFLFNMTF